MSSLSAFLHSLVEAMGVDILQTYCSNLWVYLQDTPQYPRSILSFSWFYAASNHELELAPLKVNHVFLHGNKLAVQKLVGAVCQCRDQETVHLTARNPVAAA